MLIPAPIEYARSKLSAIKSIITGRGTNPLINHKLELIDLALTELNAHSFADLGGVWGVNGGYTFYALEKHKLLTKAVLVDTHPTNEMTKRSENFPQLRFIHGNFGDKRIVEEVGQVDAIFLFDVLLHQVAPNWDEVLESYAHQTRCMVIFNQQWTGTSSTVRLLDLGENEYFRNVPHNRHESTYSMLFQKLHEKHPDHDRVWKDVHHIWQWGITDLDLKNKLESLGFRMQYSRNCGQFGKLANFENHAFIFTK